MSKPEESVPQNSSLPDSQKDKILEVSSTTQEPRPTIDSSESIEQRLKLQEQELKIEELKLKIRDLKKPESRKFTSWTSATAVLIALGGVLGQNILSNIKNERALLDVREAQIKKDSANKFVERAKLELTQALDSQRLAEKHYADLKLHIDNANKTLTELKAYTAHLSTQEGNAISSTQLDTINKLIRKTKENLPNFSVPLRAVDINTIVGDIMTNINLKANFKLIESKDVDNVFATQTNGERTIVYSRDFVNRIRNATKTNWSAIFILAHEIGHHLSGHMLANADRTINDNRFYELEADEFAGFTLGKMGAPLNETLTVFQTFNSNNANDENSIHPSKEKRIVAAKKGWLRSQKR